MEFCNFFKIFTKKQVGLALGSGGAKGLSHISVIKFLENMGIPIHKIAGSSIGALVGACYACGTLDDFKKDALDITKKEIYSLFDITFPRSGLLKGEDLLRFLERYIPKNTLIENLPIELSILATDYSSGKSVIFRQGPVMEALRASISIPGVFVPVPFKKTFLIDGGVANPLPIETVKMMGADLTVAVNLHPGLTSSKINRFLKARAQKRDFNIYSDDSYFIGKEITQIDSDEEKASQDKWEWFSSIKDYVTERSNGPEIPNIFDIMFRSIDIMEIANTRHILMYNKPTVLVEPRLLHVGVLDFDNVYDILTEGYRACADVAPKLKRKIKTWV